MRRHLYYYTHVEADYTSSAAAFADTPRYWLPAPAEQDGDGWAVDLSAEGALPSAIAHHRVIVTVGPVSDGGDRLLRSITWRSATSPGIFPVFDGDLELTELQGSLCQLSLMGSYRPPLAVAGSAADALLGHHVAEACVRRFILESAAKLVAGVTLHA